jgi:branched-chain amino acid aminotransferase
MSEPMVFLNGELVPRSRAQVSVRNPSFRHGEGIFETLRGRGERAFRTQCHLDRLRASAAALRWRLPWPAAELQQALCTALRANALSESRVRIHASPGASDGSACEPVLLVEVEPFVAVPEEVRQAGVALQLWPYRRSRQGGILSRAKTASYLENLLARRAAREDGAHDALFVTDEGLVSETACANVFAVLHGKMRTPPLEGGVLAGVTRQVVLETGAAGAREETLTLNDLHTADEIFITSTGVEILPVISLDGARVGNGAPGPVAREVGLLYRRVLDDELPSIAG